ncbi:tyrosine-type recombinase/integrase [Marinivivus vitaminiproducens]|uniref:tyrosine-type recombinase/integrase n=1 Tax=Marinivivus vitaminiproducens TaxID=3035935 RepID=UPI0027A093F0|nr:site-specific integrase [Geminicoccaceae bacterium SCSIO 64248]
MQTYSLSTPGLWTGLEDWPHRACVDAVVAAMQAERYSAKSIYQFVQSARRFAAWRGETTGDAPLAYDDTDRSLAHRRATAVVPNGQRKALARLREAMVQAGVLSLPPVVSGPADDILQQFEASLVRRGYKPKSVGSYIWFARPFLQELWDGETELTAGAVLAYIERNAGQRSTTTVRIMCSRIRVLLRFLHAEGQIGADLAAAIPSARGDRSAGLPSYLAPDQVEAVLVSCDRDTVAGRRDHAVLMLLARLGLRAAEVALLTLDDVDWRAGVLRVIGKGGRVAQMPLPSDVGEALAVYIRRDRPASASRTIFHRVETPCGPFTTSTPVILIARRALRRAGVRGSVRGASHVFRHSLATHLIRSGASLNEIGQVLRHQEPDTARIYAKVDVAGLRSLSLAWPGGAR